MKIGELSSATGVPTRLLRYYEEQQLISPSRRSNGYREFDASDIERVATIRGLIQSGLSTRLIRIVIDMDTVKGTALAATCTARFAEMLTTELRELDDRIACLTRSREAISGFLAKTRFAAAAQL